MVEDEGHAAKFVDLIDKELGAGKRLDKRVLVELRFLKGQTLERLGREAEALREYETIILVLKVDTNWIVLNNLNLAIRWNPENANIDVNLCP